ncbi:MAG TPA: hypothetical protein VKN36_11100, partial [Eudoraea sp.]|nr:hypothetical protein [Eudoraea sp.]
LPRAERKTYGVRLERGARWSDGIFLFISLLVQRNEAGPKVKHTVYVWIEEPDEAMAYLLLKPAASSRPYSVYNGKRNSTSSILCNSV